MRRRKLIQFGMISASVILGTLGLSSIGQVMPQDDSKQQIYDWAFLYWMPYDNDLSEFSNSIIAMIRDGVQTDNLLVAIESDVQDSRYLKKYTITERNIDTETLAATNSASEQSFSDFLTWAKNHFTARHWAVIILGHGGRLAEISPDEQPTLEPSAAQWMNLEKMSQVLTQFNRDVNGSVELLFFQNCNKGTIEAHYTCRNAAKYTLSSQFVLGAPNYYYEPLLRFVGQYPELNGGQLAEKIVEFEQARMYHTCTITNNPYLSQLPIKVNPIISSILACDIKNIQLNRAKSYSYMDETFVDVIAVFEMLVNQSNADLSLYKEFATFIQDNILYKVIGGGILFDPDTRNEYRNFSGLGIFLPKSRNEIEQYCHLSVFSDLNFIQLFEAVLPAM